VAAQAEQDGARPQARVECLPCARTAAPRQTPVSADKPVPRSRGDGPGDWPAVRPHGSAAISASY
jgi:hypothetical protein